MKALSLTQPWATLVAIGAKKVETRSWSTKHRGLIAIHAAKGFPTWAKDECYSSLFARHLWPISQVNISGLIDSLPRGAIVAVATIVACKATTDYHGVPFRWISELSNQERTFGNYDANRYGWFLENVAALVVPVPCRGALSLWDVPFEVREAVIQQVESASDAQAASA